jgi:polycomb protein EED
MFATVGERKVRVFELGASGLERKETENEGESESQSGSQGGESESSSPSFRLLQEYEESHAEEQYFALAWSVGKVGEPLVCVAGELGIIKVLNVDKECMEAVLPGHGNSINELQSHPTRPALVLSASKDESIRLWNIHTSTAVMIFAGLDGHRSDVLSIDFHQSNIERFASGGIDNTVKIWSLVGPKDDLLLEKSFEWDNAKEERAFPTASVQTPVFSSNFHDHYVDCVKWYGDLLLSKSIHNCVVLWKPEYGKNGASDGIIPLKTFKLRNCEIWFMKFSLSADHCLISLGNCSGKVHFWEVEGKQSATMILSAHTHGGGRPKGNGSNRKLVIRNSSISYDGKFAVCCCENGQVCCWNIERMNPIRGGQGQDNEDGASPPSTET